MKLHQYEVTIRLEVVSIIERDKLPLALAQLIEPQLKQWAAEHQCLVSKPIAAAIDLDTLPRAA